MFLKFHLYRIFINIKAVNKARLETVETIGPVTIDFTPPVYGSGLHLETGELFILSWPTSAFYDAEDPELLTEYYWALGMLVS